MSGKAYFSDFADRLTTARAARRQGVPWEDPDRPASLDDDAYLFAMKVAAYREGGPDPESDEATGYLEEVPLAPVAPPR